MQQAFPSTGGGTAMQDRPRIDRRRDNLVRLAEVKARTGLSRTTIYRKMGAGTFPPSKPISAGLVAWYESDINAWIADPMGWSEAA